MASKVILGEGSRVLRVKFEHLAHVKDLHTMVNGLGADDSVAADYADLAPPRPFRVVRRKTTEVGQFAFTSDFRKRCAVVLSNGNKLAAGFFVRPAPA